jgi:hypothetical protein
MAARAKAMVSPAAATSPFVKFVLGKFPALPGRVGWLPTCSRGECRAGTGDRNRSGPVSHSGSLIRTRVDPPIDDDFTVLAIADLASEDAGATLP